MALPVEWKGSPNRTRGRSGYRPEAIVVHIMEGTLRGTDQWFANPESKVSAHYGVGRRGEIHQYVAEGDTAWHAGRVHQPTWAGLRAGVNPNLYTIGVEHEGQADTEWSEEMYRASAALLREVANRWSIPLDRDHVVGHREIYARKTCPGHKVDLDRLVRLAREEAAGPAGYNLCPGPGTVEARVDLNVRRAAPTTAAEVVRTIPAGQSLRVTGWTSNGLSVNGNAHWYRDEEGNYVWAGGTRQPIPGLTP